MPLIRFKQGAKANGLQPEAIVAMMVVASVYHSYGYEYVITSITDYVEGRHPRSKHPAGLAFDSRISHLDPDDVQPIFDTIRRCLTDEYDVVLKSDHIHIEFDIDE